jgi:hypothetical protein
MVPMNGRCAIGLFFWEIRRLLAAIIVVRSAQQGELSLQEIELTRHLHAHFQTALRRLHSRERERAVRVALEQFMRRVPLPTVLLRWNLRLAYRNQAAAESCAEWHQGPSGGRFIKLTAPVQSLRETIPRAHARAKASQFPGTASQLQERKNNEL